ncbi:MAG: helix-turn-helix domain-containing protein [Phycisphaerales bacterium]
MAKLLEAMRRAIKQAERAGTTRYELCKRTRVSQAVVSRFMAGTRGLGVDVIERLADGLDMEVVLRNRTKRKGR